MKPTAQELIAQIQSIVDEHGADVKYDFRITSNDADQTTKITIYFFKGESIVDDVVVFAQWKKG